ncbi:MAG: PAS domain S-box protein [Blastocatellia bacterium]
MPNIIQPRLLLIEANPAEALRWRAALCDFPAPGWEIVQVEQLAQGLTQLQQTPFAAVLVDLDLPEATGLVAVTTLQQQIPDVPILVFVDLENEATGMQAVQAGAQDYLVKSQVTAPQLRHALSCALERQHVCTNLRKSQHQFQQLVEGLPQLIWTYEPDSHTFYASPQLLAYIGATAAEINRRVYVKYVHPDDQERLRQTWRTMVATGAEFHVECRLRRADGIYRWFDTRVLPIGKAAGQGVQWFGTSTDIQEQHEIRAALLASEERIRLATEAAQIGLWERDLNTGQLIWSPQQEQLMGYEPGAFPCTYEAFLALVHPADRARLAEAQHIARTEGTYRTELRFCRPDGTERWGLLRGKIIYQQDGQSARLLGIDMDITERKRVEATLRQSHEHLRLMIEQAPVSIAMFDREMRYLAASQRWKEDFNCTERELIGQLHYEFFPNLPERWKAIHRQALAGEFLRADDDEWVHPNGDRRWASWAVHPWRNAYQEIGGIIISTENVTYRKQAEMALRENEQRLHAIVGNLAEGLIILELDGHLSRWNRAALEMHGLQGISQSVIRLPEMEKIFELSTPEGRVLNSEERPNARIRRGEVLRDYEVCIHRKGTDWQRIFSYSGNIIQEDSGMPLALLTIHDITERKQAEQQLRLWADAFNHCALGLAIGDPVTNRIVACNPAFAQQQGQPVQEIENIPILSLYVPDERETIKQHIAVADRTGKATYESNMLHKDGTAFPVQIDIVSVRDEQKTPVYRVVTRQDISARKQAEEQLRQSEAHFRAIFEASSVGSVECDAYTGRFLRVNQQMCEIVGYTAEELLQRTFIEITHPDDRAAMMGQYKEFITGQVPAYAVEKRYLHKDGSFVWVSVTSSLLMDEAGTPWHTLAVIQDITARKHSEEVQRESEERFRNLADTAPVLIWMSGTDKICHYFNQVWLDFTGRTLEEEAGNGWMQGVHPDDYERCLDTYITAFDSRQIFEMEYRLRRADGEFRWILDKGIPRFTHTGEFLGYLGSCIDITDRKHAEEELRESENRFRTLFEQSSVGKFIVEYDTLKVVDCNPAAAKDLGYTKEEMLELTLKEIVAGPATTEISINHQILAERKSLKLQAKHRAKSGEIRDALVVLTNLRTHGKDYVYSSVLDITEQKRAEEELQRERLRLEKIAFSSPSVIYSFRVTADGQYSYPYVSAAFYDLYGVRQKDVLQDARNTAKVVHPDDRPGLAQSIKDSAYNLSRWHHAWRINHPDKGELWVEGHSAPVREADGSTVWHGILNDVTEQKRAEQKLRNSEERLTLALAAARMGVWQWQLQTNEVFWSPECYEIQGVKEFNNSVEEFTRIVHPDDLAWLMQAVQQSLAEKSLFSAQFRLIRPDNGKEIWVLNLARAEYDPQGNPIRMVGIVQDITERKLAEVELEQSLEQVRSLALHLQDIREEERKRIAREIHDELGQALAGLKFDLFWLENHLVPNDSVSIAACREKTHEMTGLLRSTIEVGRKIATELRPRILDDLGLVTALQWQAQEFQTRTHIRCTFWAVPENIALEAAQATAMFRIFQETLTNVARHAQADAVRAELTMQDGQLILSIQDNGRGITPSEIHGIGSLGLLGMRERLLPFGGTLQIHGERGQGTTVTATLPSSLPQEESYDTGFIG